MVIHLEIRAQQATALRGGAIICERLLVAENVAIELASGSQIIRAQADMSNAKNLGARRSGGPLGRDAQRDDSKETWEDGKVQSGRFHGFSSFLRNSG
jgi:hypothetical protein